jgi:benzoyl-CoA reductase/2-hydroxyglutaryl-CoA dehydratase subunit BcrC/BadD/HgdB
MSEEKKLTRKKIEATKLMNKYMSDYFYELDRASKTGDEKVAWCTSVGPSELLLSMGFKVYYPENHGALLGTSRLAAEVIPDANAIGYSPDICSYLTSDIGAYIKGITPLSKAFEGIENVPKPDVLIYNTNQCRDVKDWFACYARKLNVPLLGIHTHRNPTEINGSIVPSIANQIENLLEPLEKISGNKFEMEKLKKVVALSRECSELWKEVLETASSSPSPLTFFDGTIHMGPAVVLRGTEDAVEYYKVLLKELKERVKNGEGAIEDEQFRIYWEGMPVWGRLRSHSELFADLKACVLASTYCNSWIFTDFDPEDPFTSMAKAYTELFIVKSDEAKEKYMKKMIDIFKIDGIVFHDAKTCPNNSNNRYGMPQRLTRETGVPSITINGDLNDLRLISDEQTKTNIEAFIEQLEENRI